MDARTFLQEAARMCKAQKGCDKCPIKYQELNGCPFSDSIPERWAPEEIGRIVPIVEQWSAEHPRKTRLMDFRGKYPDALLKDTGIPLVSPVLLGYCKGMEHCTECRYRDTAVEWCWGQEVEEDAD